MRSAACLLFHSRPFKGGENRFRSESFALQIHWEVRGRGSGFQQHRFSRVWCSVSPGSSGRLDGVRHVAFGRQTQVRILQTQPGMCRRESPDSWCKHQDRSSCSRPKTAGEHEGKRQDALHAISNCFTDIISIGKLDPGSTLDFFSFRSGV